MSSQKNSRFRLNIGTALVVSNPYIEDIFANLIKYQVYSKLIESGEFDSGALRDLTRCINYRIQMDREQRNLLIRIMKYLISIDILDSNTRSLCEAEIKAPNWRLSERDSETPLIHISLSEDEKIEWNIGTGTTPYIALRNFHEDNFFGATAWRGHSGPAKKGEITEGTVSTTKTLIRHGLPHSNEIKELIKKYDELISESNNLIPILDWDNEFFFGNSKTRLSSQKMADILFQMDQLGITNISDRAMSPAIDIGLTAARKNLITQKKYKWLPPQQGGINMVGPLLKSDANFLIFLNQHSNDLIEHFEKVMNFLEESGKLDNTVIVAPNLITADQRHRLIMDRIKRGNFIRKIQNDQIVILIWNHIPEKLIIDLKHINYMIDASNMFDSSAPHQMETGINFLTSRSIRIYSFGAAPLEMAYQFERSNR